MPDVDCKLYKACSKTIPYFLLLFVFNIGINQWGLMHVNINIKMRTGIVNVENYYGYYSRKSNQLILF